MYHDQIHHQRGKAQSNGPGKAFLWRTHILNCLIAHRPSRRDPGGLMVTGP